MKKLLGFRWNLCEEPIFYRYDQIYVIPIDVLKAGNVFHEETMAFHAYKVKVINKID